MNQKDIIELANKIADQVPQKDWNTNVWVFGKETLVKFVELVIAVERKENTTADRELMQRALDALEKIAEAMPFPVALLTRAALRERLARSEQNRKWQKLTDAEIFASLKATFGDEVKLTPGFRAFARIIETKLKEKNA